MNSARPATSRKAGYAPDNCHSRQKLCLLLTLENSLGELQSTLFKKDTYHPMRPALSVCYREMSILEGPIKEVKAGTNS